MEILKWLLRIITFIGIIFLIAKRGNKKRNIMLISICVISFIGSAVLTIYPFFHHTYYDRLGNSYNNISEVVYYTKDNCLFTLDENNLEFVCKDKSLNPNYMDTYAAEISYVDSDGYLSFIEKTLDESNNNAYSSYDPQTGKYYIFAEFAKWDKNGKLQPLFDYDTLNIELYLFQNEAFDTPKGAY